MREPVSITTATIKDYFKAKLKDIKIINLNRFVIFHISINSTRNKFELLVEGFIGNGEILMVTEKKKMNLFQQAYLSHLISLNHIAFTELKMVEDIHSKLLTISHIASEI